MKTSTFRSVGLTLAVAVTLSACATTGGRAGGQTDSCNPWATGAVGAVLGAALGATRDRDSAAKGAIAGAAIGALGCLAVNASTRTTQSPGAVEDDYRQTHATLPASPTLLAYETRINPGTTITGGQNVEVISDLKIINGSMHKISSVREELVLLDTEGKEFRRVRKDVTSDAGGGYENKFTFAFPNGVSQGVYGIRTELLINEEIVGQNGEDMRLVFIEGNKIHLAFR